MAHMDPSPFYQKRPPLAPHRGASPAPGTSVLVGEHLANAIKAAPAGRRIGVRLAALGGHLLLGLDEPARRGAGKHPEDVYSRICVPPQGPSSPLDDVVGAIERGLGALCGVEAALVHQDGNGALAVEITRSSRSDALP
jgi:hypothetical protein